MKTRAARRADARTVSKIMEKSGEDLDTVSELAATRRDLDLAKEYLKTYKTRLERTAMALQFVSNAIIANKIHEAQVAMRSIMANDLKEARECVGNRAQALDIALKIIQDLRKGWAPDSDYENIVSDAFKKIKILSPESMGGEVEMAAAVASEVKS